MTSRFASDPLESVLEEFGPSLSGKLVQVLVERHGLKPEAARKRISRGGGNVRRLRGLTFPHRASFYYLEQQFGSPFYWDSLIRSLLESKSAHGLGLAAILERGGVIPLRHFASASGAPVRQLRHTAPETIVATLIKANLIKELELPGVGTCLALVQGANYYDGRGEEVSARLVAESILLEALKTWIKNLGIGSFDRVALRDEAEQPKIASTLWDLTAPSYLGGLLTYGTGEKPKPGFVACDVLLGGSVSEQGIRPFIHKCEAIRGLPNVGRCLQIFVANGFTKEAFILAKQKGIVPATVENLFGRDVAVGLTQLTNVLKDAATFVRDPIAFNKLFERLKNIEGAATNLRGALFEYVAAELARTKISSQIEMNRIFKDGPVIKAEVDVVSTTPKVSVHFIEAKGYKPRGTIPDELVKKWLEERVPWVYREARKHSDWKSLKIVFEFWTSGILSSEAKQMIAEAQQKIRPNKYTVSYLDSEGIRALALETKDAGLIKNLEEHFLKHPLSEPDVDPTRRDTTRVAIPPTAPEIEADVSDNFEVPF
ncbi:hypothetical protein [Luteolibacter sp. Populi]|uniref:hypothetical protein n=1 Tax=Luteolibacter sp. Populi TaxID=3230487 RepID=UPI003466C9ED